MIIKARVIYFYSGGIVCQRVLLGVFVLGSFSLRVSEDIQEALQQIVYCFSETSSTQDSHCSCSRVRQCTAASDADSTQESNVVASSVQ